MKFRILASAIVLLCVAAAFIFSGNTGNQVIDIMPAATAPATDGSNNQPNEMIPASQPASAPGNNDFNFK